MARVASCPQCQHDLLIPDETQIEAWAKCPECRAFFQVSQAALRVLPQVLLVESPETEIDSTALGDDLPELDADDVVDGELSDVSPDTNTQAIEDGRSTNELRAAAERIDDWFRSAKTVADAPAIFDRMAESGGDESDIDDIEGREASPATLEDVAPSGPVWDDAQHMDQLLADIDTPSPAAPPVASAPVEEQGMYSDAIAATSVSDLPLFSKHANGKPRRKRSMLRTLSVCAIAGVVGLAIGYYVLLWIAGRDGDFLQVAQYLPSFMLPSEDPPQPRAFATAAPRSEPPGETIDAADNAADDAIAESAEVQAAYTTEEPSATEQPASDDRYGIEATDDSATEVVAAEEPAPLDIAAAEPVIETPPAEAPVVADGPAFSMDDLNAAVEAAKVALPSLTAGSLEDGRDVQRAKANGYLVLADLAQKTTFVDTSGGDSAGAIQAAEAVFRTALSDEHTRSEVGKIVPKWIASPHRKHGGVFFAAVLGDGQQSGPVFEYRGMLETGQALVILVPANYADKLDESGRPMGVVGWIVDRPSEKIAGYTGSAQQAIWAGKLIELD